jgi:hypothetical protein
MCVKKIQDMGATRKTVDVLAGYLGCDPNNLSIQPRVRFNRLQRSVSEIGYISGRITLRLPRGDTYAVALYDSKGRRILRQRYVAGDASDRTETLDARGLARGVYTIRIDGNNTNAVSRKLTLFGR